MLFIFNLNSVTIFNNFYFQFIKSKTMKYLTNKALVAVFLVCGAFAQSTVNPEDPQWGWADYK